MPLLETVGSTSDSENLSLLVEHARATLHAGRTHVTQITVLVDGSDQRTEIGRWRVGDAARLTLGDEWLTVRAGTTTKRIISAKGTWSDAMIDIEFQDDAVPSYEDEEDFNCMVEYRDLNAPPSQTMAEIVAGLKEKAESSKTGAAGVKDMGYYGNIVWNRADGDSLVSIRDIDNGLDEARDRISDALQESAEAMLRADEAKIESGEAQGRLDELDEVTLPAIRDEIAEGSGSNELLSARAASADR